MYTYISTETLTVLNFTIFQLVYAEVVGLRQLTKIEVQMGECATMNKITKISRSFRMIFENGFRNSHYI